MLVLTRKKNETILIDGRIAVEVLQVKGGGVRLGITAPEDVRILRGELKPFNEPPARTTTPRVSMNEILISASVESALG